MDSFTQAALGAAVGEAVLGRKTGNKAIIWGAVAGTIPDLDILTYPFVSEIQELAIHRGLSHSFFFVALASPLLGMAVARLHRKGELHWTKWAWLFFWGLLTHILLDSLTLYGTQLFYPFSNYPVSFNTISIIDPLYTLPVVAGLVIALRSREYPLRRKRANQAGLVFSSLYLLMTLACKAYFTTTFAAALQRQGIAYERLLTNPTLFNNMLWYGIAVDGDQYRLGLHSAFDKTRTISFQSIDGAHELLEPFRDQAPVQRLLWFSKGFYAVQQADGTYQFADIRFPRSDLWLDNGGSYLFSFRLLRDPTNPQVFSDFENQGFSETPSREMWRTFARRIAGFIDR